METSVLSYEYDKAGNRTKIGGSWARTGMPEPITTTSYDSNNRQLTFGDKKRKEGQVCC